MYKMSVIVCVDDSDGAMVRKGDYSTRTEDWDPKSKKRGPNWGGPSIASFDLIIVIIRLIQNSGSKHTSIIDRIIFCNVKEIYNFFQILCVFTSSNFWAQCLKCMNLATQEHAQTMCISNLIPLWKLLSLELN